MTEPFDEALVEAVAIARFAADDGCSINAAATLLLAGKGAEHHGDCTNEAQTCARCLYDHEMACARAALSIAVPRVREMERERCAKMADGMAQAVAGYSSERVVHDLAAAIRQQGEG